MRMIRQLPAASNASKMRYYRTKAHGWNRHRRMGNGTCPNARMKISGPHG